MFILYVRRLLKISYARLYVYTILALNRQSLIMSIFQTFYFYVVVNIVLCLQLSFAEVYFLLLLLFMYSELEFHSIVCVVLKPGLFLE